MSDEGNVPNRRSSSSYGFSVQTAGAGTGGMADSTEQSSLYPVACAGDGGGNDTFTVAGHHGGDACDEA